MREIFEMARPLIIVCEFSPKSSAVDLIPALTSSFLSCNHSSSQWVDYGKYTLQWVCMRHSLDGRIYYRIRESNIHLLRTMEEQLPIGQYQLRPTNQVVRPSWTSNLDVMCHNLVNCHEVKAIILTKDALGPISDSFHQRINCNQRQWRCA